MSDSKKNPKMPPPDDFSKTTPNIQADDFDDSPADWDKTQYGSPSEAPADDWGKTVINYNVSALDDEEDFGKQLHPSKNDPKEADWGVTQPNVNLNDDFEPNDPGNREESMDGATVPYFKLPEADRAKYQNVPLTPTEKAKKEAEAEKNKGGIPAWFWITAGMMAMFSFAVLVLLGVWFFFTGPSSFTVKVKGAQPFSDYLVDDARWGVTNSDGMSYLPGLRPGRRKIIIRKKGYDDDEHEVTGEPGDEIEIIARQIARKNECAQIDLTNVKQREDCANIILNNLGTPPNLDDLLKALNLYYINFSSGQHTIPPGREKFLERAASYMKQLPATVVIEVGGHTDSRGGDKDNLALSERRANSVKTFFENKGINPGMLTTRGYGKDKPKESNETEAGRFQNRRIEYTVLKK